MRKFHLKLIVFLICLFSDEGSARCPDRGWTEFRGSCYRVFRTRTNYLGAQDTCVRSRANLTSVHSKAELVFLTAISAGQADNNFWIGLLRTSGAYTWVDGTAMTSWASSNIAFRNRDCGAVAGETMVTRPCYFFYYFICKKPAEITSTTATPSSTTSTSSTTYTTTPSPTTTTTSTTTMTSSSTTSTTSTTTSTTTTSTTTSATSTTSTSAAATSRLISMYPPTSAAALTAAITTTTTSSTAPLATTTASGAKTTTLKRESLTDMVQDLIWVKKKSDTASVPDNRPSAVGIGAFGVFIMAAIFVLVFLMDIGTFIRHFRWMRRNLKHFCRKANRHGLCEIDKNRI